MSGLAFTHSFVERDAGYDAWGALAVGDFDGDGRLAIVGKVWRANAVNGADGRNHVDYLKPIRPGKR